MFFLRNFSAFLVQFRRFSSFFLFCWICLDFIVDMWAGLGYYLGVMTTTNETILKGKTMETTTENMTAELNLNVGTRVYYTGDMANCDGKGTVVVINPADRFCATSYKIVLDDGRVMRAIFANNFFGIGKRFWTMAAWRANRQRGIAQMEQDMKKLRENGLV